MSHTYIGKDVRIHYNGDGSGLAHIQKDDPQVDMLVPVSDLIGFVACFVRSSRVAELEDIPDDVLVGLRRR
jgi:hypothetical protein